MQTVHAEAGRGGPAGVTVAGNEGTEVRWSREDRATKTITRTWASTAAREGLGDWWGDRVSVPLAGALCRSAEHWLWVKDGSRRQ